MRYDLDAVQENLDILSMLDRLGVTYQKGSGRANGEGTKLLNPLRNDRHFGSCSVTRYRGRWYVSDFADRDCSMSIFKFIQAVKMLDGESLSFSQAVEFALGGRAEAMQFTIFDGVSYDGYAEDTGKPAPLTAEELKLIGLGGRINLANGTWTGAVIGTRGHKPDPDELDKGVSVTAVSYPDKDVVLPGENVPQMLTEYLLTRPVTGMSLATLYNQEFDVYKNLVWNKSVDALCALSEIITATKDRKDCDSLIACEKAERKQAKIYAMLRRVFEQPEEKQEESDRLDELIALISF